MEISLVRYEILLVFIALIILGIILMRNTFKKLTYLFFPNLFKEEIEESNGSR